MAPRARKFVQQHRALNPDLVSDYASLVTTRLDDVRVAMDSNNDGGPPMHDTVVATLRTFAALHGASLPAGLRQLMVFRKEAFRKKFLPSLLSNPYSSQSFLARAEFPRDEKKALMRARRDLISFMEKEGSIPSSIYAQYADAIASEKEVQPADAGSVEMEHSAKGESALRIFCASLPKNAIALCRNAQSATLQADVAALIGEISINPDDAAIVALINAAGAATAAQMNAGFLWIA